MFLQRQSDSIEHMFEFRKGSIDLNEDAQMDV